MARKAEQPADELNVDDTINRAIGSMIPADDQSMMTRIYHVTEGISPWMYKIDARIALANHPGEWSDKPWPAAKG